MPGVKVGVLLPVPILGRVVRRQPIFEEVDLYRRAAGQLQVDLVLFSTGGCDLARGTVRGYVWRDGRWVDWEGPLPRAVHNRVLPGTPREARTIRGLGARLGYGFFNPLAVRDKWHVWRQLAEDGWIKQHLPATWPLQAGEARRLPERVRAYGGIVLKPRVGSWGLGTCFIEPAEGRGFRWIRARGPAARGGAAEVAGFARRLAGPRYIMQQTIPLMRYGGRRCDLRIPVQRDGGGSWAVLPGTVKQAVRHPFLTNIARGGRAYPLDQVLPAVFPGGRWAGVVEHIEGLALAVAHQLAKHYPQLADIGLDLGVDGGGKPWVIEVNFRDQRLPAKEAGQRETHAQLYYNPIAYARYLLEGA